LATVHDAGLVHGNVTPTNVLIDLRGEPLLSDIGSTSTAAGRQPSAAHAAPEVLEHQRPSAASDIYSLGSTVYAVLAGREPFADVDVDGSPDALAEAKRDRDPAPLRDFGVLDRVSDIVARCMARRPGDRYASARIVAEALAQAQRNGATPSTPPEVPARRLEAVAPPPAPVEPAAPAPVPVVPVPAPPAAPAAAPPAAAPPAAVPAITDTRDADATETIEAVAPVDSTGDTEGTEPVGGAAPAVAAAAEAGVATEPGTGEATFVPFDEARPRDLHEEVVGMLGDDEERARMRRRLRTIALLAVTTAIAVGGAAVALTRGNPNPKARSNTTVTTAPKVVHTASLALHQSFPTVELGRTPALVSQLWATSTDRRTLTATINVSNASRASLKGTLRVVIPKSVSPSVSDVHFVPNYSVVITQDPKVAYRMNIAAGGAFIVHYQVHFATPLTAAALAAHAKDEVQALAADAKSLGAPPPKLVSVQLAIAPTAASLRITQAGHFPTVALHATESFAGVVLHDPVLWRSSKAAVADVDTNGRVTGYSSGSAVISATVGSVTARATIVVDDQTTTTTAAPPTSPLPTPPPGTNPPRTTTTRQVPPTTVPRTTTTHAPTTTTLPPTTTTVPVTTPPTPANPDVNGDGVVGCLDYGLVDQYQGTNNAAEDINGDGVVNSADLDAILADYTQPDGDGTTFGSACPP
jgi:hypothetical protein